MNQYEITYTETVTYRVQVLANNVHEAKRAVRNDDGALGIAEPIAYGPRKITETVMPETGATYR